MSTRFCRFTANILWDREARWFGTATARNDVLAQFDAWKANTGAAIIGIQWAKKGDFGVRDAIEGQHRWDLEVIYDDPYS